MDDEIVNLAARRAKTSGDSRLMSVGDCLEEALRDSRDGRWDKCFLILHRDSSADTFCADLRVAGCTTLEARGLLLTAVKGSFDE